MGCILVGASPKARQVLDFLASEGRAGEIVGFVDCDPAKQGQTFRDKPIFGNLELAVARGLHRQHAFCVCLSERRFGERMEYMRRLAQVDAKVASIVSSRSQISSEAHVEAGCLIFPQVTVNIGAQIGTCVTIYTGCLIDHDCTIADNVELSPRVAMAGGASVESGAFLGINATILPHRTIGSFTVVGAGAVVTRDVSAGDIVVGNPARVLRRAAA
jgi:sugar O-acyltransferase (sialic acid O-acetyltransferase NeuD family)